MDTADLAVTSHYKLNVKLFVLNNDGYMSIRNTQREYFNGMLVGTDPASGVFIPKMECQAKTYHLPFLRCERANDLRSVIDQALAIEGPVLVEINALRDQRIIPTVMSERLPDGRMQSKPLHEMYPYLSENEVNAELEKARSAF